MRVSIFYYSMTRQCEAAARAVAAALPDGAQAQLIRVQPTEPRWMLAVPFVPLWRTFFATLRPTQRGDAIAIATEPATWPESDAVVVGSATWWNRPCLPILALLRQPAFRAHVAGKPVGIFAGCRGFYRKNLAVCQEEIATAGGRVVARERFSYTGSVLGTFLAFFAMLRFGTARARWLGLHVPPYGFGPRTLERARGFAARIAGPAPAALPSAHLETAVRAVYTGLALFDLFLAIAFIFFGAATVGRLAPAAFAEPQFFQRCVGLFLLQYVFVQGTAARDPIAYATCLNMTVAIRATFPILYLSQVFLWGAPWTVLHGLLVVSAAGDVGATIFTLVAMRRLGLPFFGGDASADDDAPASGLLRWILLVLAVSELAIAWNWLLLPRFWCGVFDLAVPVDPFWTRATGLFLLNIAYIQFLAFRDLHRHRTAVMTSGLFRMLWPVLYWITAGSRAGNEAFRAFILFFSFFDLTACFAIFGLLHRVTRRSEATTTNLGPAVSS